MLKSFALALFVFFLVAADTARAASRHEETIPLTETRKLSLVIPDGFTYQATKDEAGAVNVQLATAHDRLTLNLVFLPDPEGEFANARARKEKMVELFQSFVDSSVEKAMQFEELEPKVGAGTYCVFTDAGLVGKAPYPPGDYLHFTTGVKAWPGVVVIFGLFSNDTTSPDYLAAMKMLRESVGERAAQR
jgi:hypothetical protein